MPDVRIRFSKHGASRFISHLDLMRTLQRGFLRAGITIRHTEGYHPHPYVSIPLPLPLGFSSDCEIMEFGLVSGATMESLPAQLTAALPQGITVLECYEKSLPFRKLTYVRYAITLEFDAQVAQEATAAFREMIGRENLVVTKKSKKAKTGQKELDLIPLITSLEKTDGAGHTLTVQLLLQAQNPGLNPDILLNAFRQEYPHFGPIYPRFHRVDVLDPEKRSFR